jgi:hypothetical protein
MNRFKISICSSSSRTRLRSRASSLADSTCSAGAVFSHCRTQVTDEVSEMPSYRATSLIGRPDDRNRATASSLNSSLYRRVVDPSPIPTSSSRLARGVRPKRGGSGPIRRLRPTICHRDNSPKRSFRGSTADAAKHRTTRSDLSLDAPWVPRRQRAASARSPRPRSAQAERLARITMN